MEVKKFIVVSGYFFLILGILDFILKVKVYGFREMDFLWFCSITMFILGLGMILKNEILLNSFISIALLVQPFWISDFVLFSFFGVKVNGLSSYVFQPGYSLVQYLDNSKHLLMIPFGLYAVFMVSRKNLKSYIFTPALIVMILASSYIISPEGDNLNCAVKPCINIFKNFNGIGYSLVYLSAIVLLSLAINFMINAALEKTEKYRKNKHYKNAVLILFLIMIFASLGSVVAGYIKYSKVPQYNCLKSENCIDCSVSINCDHIEYSEGSLYLVYTIKNQGQKQYTCEVYMEILPKASGYKKINENYFMGPHTEYRIYQNVSYPGSDSQIKLKSNCTIWKQSFV